MATKKVNNEEEEVVVTEKKFKQDDLILCRSIVNGGLYIEGERSKILYRFADAGDTMEIEYRDLIYMVRTRANSNIYEPRIIIEDDDFINQNKELKEFYSSLYTTKDFVSILKLPIPQMEVQIKKLPNGIRESLKGLAATMIDNHTLDSVQKIKALDEIFGTKMLLTLAQE